MREVQGRVEMELKESLSIVKIKKLGEEGNATRMNPHPFYFFLPHSFTSSSVYALREVFSSSETRGRALAFKTITLQVDSTIKHITMFCSSSGSAVCGLGTKTNTLKQTQPHCNKR